MREINILFLAPHWSVSLVKAFQQSRDRAGLSGKLAGADSNPHASTLQILRPARVIRRFDDPECLAETLDLCARESIHAVLPLSNRALEFIDANREPFRKARVELFLPARETVAVCHDKLKLGEFFAANGIPAPAAVFPGSPKNDFRFPLFAKRRRGEGGNDCFLIEDRRDLEFYAHKYPNHVFQEFIRGREYSIDLFVDRTGKPILAVPRERLEVRGGEAWVSRIQMDPGLVEAARNAAVRLGLRGPCNLQGIRDEAGRFFFTDVNLRFGSGTVHAIAAGGDIPLMIYKELSGEPPESALGPVRDGSVMTRFHDSYFLSAEPPLYKMPDRT